ncbi:MAG: 2-oxo acid dehydrogenase subunit E2, partial [Christensenellaceae bacterium]
MQQSLATMAQLTHSSSFDATQMLAYRKMIKEGGEALGLANITLNDIVIYAVSRVLKNHRDLNAHYLDDKMRIFDNVNIGMAVDTPRGLLVPTIFGADKMSLNEISIKAKELAKAAQEGTISPDYLTNGTFTISNLGSFGVEHFTPVINPPQTGILGVNNIQTKIKMVGGEMKPYQAMGLSLTYDHRALDGAPASRFLQELCKTLENFSILLAK